MNGKPANVLNKTQQPKRALKAQKCSAKGAASLVAASVEAVSTLGFSSNAKPSPGKPSAKKSTKFQEDAGMSSGVAVSLMSKPQSDGFVAKQMPDDPAWITLLHDIETMPVMELRAKYEGEANSHRNMLQRVKSRGAVVHPAFRRFPNFLRLIGPKPTTRATVDRINNNDPEYAPGKVRWADKTTQNRNKGDSLIFTCPNTGRSYTASQLAAKQGVSPTAIRKRRKQGWKDVDIIAGKRSACVAVTPVKSVPANGKVFAAPLTAAEIAFRRNREMCEFIRETEHSEYFMCTPAEFQEIFAEDFPDIRGQEWLLSSEEAFLRKFPQWWKQYGPHIRFHALRLEQQGWILKIDPSAGQKLKLSDLL